MNHIDLVECEKALILLMPGELAIVDIYGDDTPLCNIRNIMRIVSEDLKN
mgnify:CR=1 FL=1